jgi:5-formyltetrahydrofolate cyclo-ligase
MHRDAETALRHGAKAMMRKRARALRGSMPSQALAARSARICERLLDLASFRGKPRVALFWPIEGRNEVDLRSIDVELRRRGGSIHYPSIDPEDRRMCFRLVSDVAELVDRGMRFCEPPPQAPEAEALDVIVVPGLMFDARGYRIGYGGGYYDRTLPAHCPPATAIGVAYDFQLAADVPNTEGDVPVDALVTDSRVIRAGSP